MSFIHLIIANIVVTAQEVSITYNYSSDFQLDQQLIWRTCFLLFESRSKPTCTWNFFSKIYFTYLFCYDYSFMYEDQQETVGWCRINHVGTVHCVKFCSNILSYDPRNVVTNLSVLQDICTSSPALNSVSAGQKAIWSFS